MSLFREAKPYCYIPACQVSFSQEMGVEKRYKELTFFKGLFGHFKITMRYSFHFTLSFLRNVQPLQLFTPYICKIDSQDFIYN